MKIEKSHIKTYKFIIAFLFLFTLDSSSFVTPPACSFINTSGQIRIITGFTLKDSTIDYSNSFKGVVYIDSTSQFAVLEAGNSYDYNIYAGIGFFDEFYYYFIFIDFDDDGTFSTPGDTVAYSKTKVFRGQKGTIKIPLNAKHGTHRLRVTNGFTLSTGVTTGCGDGGDNSQAVDFTVIIPRQLKLDSVINSFGNIDSVFCARSNNKIHFTTSVNLDTTNIFFAELSDKNGSFFNPDTIGKLKEFKIGSHQIICNLPDSAEGNNYKIRIISSNPYLISDSSKRFRINSNSKPIIIGDSILCINEKTIYKAIIKPNFAYIWVIDGGIIIGSDQNDSILVNWKNQGEHKITLYQTNLETFCFDSVTLYVVIYPIPKAQIIEFKKACLGEISIYKAGPDFIPSKYEWSVSNNGTIVGSSNDSILFVLWNNLVPGNIKLKKSYKSGCSDSINLNININNIKPTPSIIGIQDVCENQIYLYSVDSLKSGSTYIWKVDGGNLIGNPNSNEVNVKWNNSKTGKVNLIEQNSYDCTDSIIINVNIASLPRPIIIGDTVVCQNSIILYKANNDINTKYKWIISGGRLIGSDSSETAIIQWDNNQNGTIKLIENNTLGCKDSIFTNIKILAASNPLISGRNIACTGETLSFLSNFNNDITYLWVIEPSKIASIDGINSASEVKIKFNNPGKAILKLYQTNIMTGCIDSIKKTIYSTFISFEKLSKESYCPDDSLELKMNFNPLPDSIGLLNITLRNIKTQQIYNLNSSLNQQSILKIGISSNILSGLYNLSILCKDYQESVLIGLPSPNISGEFNICKNTISNYSTTLNSFYNYKWEVIGGSIQGANNTNNLSVLWSESGIGEIKLSITDQKGCSGYTIQPTNIYFNNLKIEGNPLICSNNLSARYFINAPGTEKNWTVNGGEIIGDIKNDFVDVFWKTNSNGRVSVSLKVPSGSCSETFSLNVSIDTTQIQNLIILGDSAVCENTKHIYRINIKPRFKLKWEVIGGKITGPDSLETCEIQFTDRQNAYILVKEIFPSGCYSLDTLFININSFLTQINGRDFVCENETTIYRTDHYDKISNKWSAIGGKIIGADNSDSVRIEWLPTSVMRVVNLNQSTLPENCQFQLSKRLYMLNPIITIKLPDIYTDPAKKLGFLDTISALVIQNECLQDLSSLPDTAEFYLNLRKTLFIPQMNNNVSYVDESNNRHIKIVSSMKSISIEKPLFSIIGNILLGDVLETSITSDSSKWSDSVQIKIISGKIRLLNIPENDGPRLLKSTKFVFSLYPNPSNGNITIEAISKLQMETKLKIFDDLGNQLFSTNWKLEKGQNELKIDSKKFNYSGSYFLLIEDGDNSSAIQFKIIK
jgi:hypothetical protein